MSPQPHGARSQPLTGVRVLEATTMIAAPIATMILADLGAEVIKVELPGAAGDPLRTHGYAKEGVGLWWLVASRGKKCLSLDLRQPRGQEIFRELAATADVVVENFRVGVMQRWGLGYDDLSVEHPELIMAHVTGFGQVGPRREEPGFGTIAEVMCGFTNRNGEPDSPPVLPPFGLADGVTAISGALAIMTALFERARSGLGQELDIAIIEPLLTVMEPQIVTQDQVGVTLGRTGNRAEMNAPRGLYRTRDDRWIAVSASTVSTARSVMEMAGGGHLADEHWFASAIGRRQHADDLDAFIVPWFEAIDAADAVDACREHGVPASLIYTPQDILDDPQYEAIGSIVTVDDDRLGPVRVPGPLFRMSRTPGSIEWLGPDHGAHTTELLRELGRTDEELEELRGSHVI